MVSQKAYPLLGGMWPGDLFTYLFSAKAQDKLGFDLAKGLTCCCLRPAPVAYITDQLHTWYMSMQGQLVPFPD